MEFDRDVDNYEVANSAHVGWAKDEDERLYILLTINDKVYRLSLDQSWRLGAALREV